MDKRMDERISKNKWAYPEKSKLLCGVVQKNGSLYWETLRQGEIGLAIIKSTASLQGSLSLIIR